MIYEIRVLAKLYYRGYLKAEHAVWGRVRRAGSDIAIEQGFEDVPKSEQDCIIIGIRTVILEIDPQATFK